MDYAHMIIDVEQNKKAFNCLVVDDWNSTSCTLWLGATRLCLQAKFWLIGLSVGCNTLVCRSHFCYSGDQMSPMLPPTCSTALQDATEVAASPALFLADQIYIIYIHSSRVFSRGHATLELAVSVGR